MSGPPAGGQLLIRAELSKEVEETLSVQRLCLHAYPGLDGTLSPRGGAQFCLGGEEVGSDAGRVSPASLHRQMQSLLSVKGRLQAQGFYDDEGDFITMETSDEFDECLRIACSTKALHMLSRNPARSGALPPPRGEAGGSPPPHRHLHYDLAQFTSVESLFDAISEDVARAARGSAESTSGGGSRWVASYLDDFDDWVVFDSPQELAEGISIFREGFYGAFSDAFHAVASPAELVGSVTYSSPPREATTPHTATTPIPPRPSLSSAEAVEVVAVPPPDVAEAIAPPTPSAASQASGAAGESSSAGAGDEDADSGKVEEEVKIETTHISQRETEQHGGDTPRVEEVFQTQTPGVVEGAAACPAAQAQAEEEEGVSAAEEAEGVCPSAEEAPAFIPVESSASLGAEDSGSLGWGGRCGVAVAAPHLLADEGFARRHSPPPSPAPAAATSQEVTEEAITEQGDSPCSLPRRTATPPATPGRIEVPEAPGTPAWGEPQVFTFTPPTDYDAPWCSPATPRGGADAETLEGGAGGGGGGGAATPPDAAAEVPAPQLPAPLSAEALFGSCDVANLADVAEAVVAGAGGDSDGEGSEEGDGACGCPEAAPSPKAGKVPRLPLQGEEVIQEAQTQPQQQPQGPSSRNLHSVCSRSSGESSTALHPPGPPPTYQMYHTFASRAMARKLPLESQSTCSSNDPHLASDRCEFPEEDSPRPTYVEAVAAAVAPPPAYEPGSAEQALERWDAESAAESVDSFFYVPDDFKSSFHPSPRPTGAAGTSPSRNSGV